jgi:hypothetical protein
MRRPTRIRVDRVPIDVYGIVARAVESGVAYGWNRAHKHSESPGADHIKCEIERAVINELSDVFIWPERS